MRISDWSSDVCSSDLSGSGGRPARLPSRRAFAHNACRSAVAGAVAASSVADGLHAAIMSAAPSAPATCAWRRALRIIAALLVASSRSEEHTSELQSLMRISYAVFCLKKKIHKNEKHTTPTTKTKK